MRLLLLLLTSSLFAIEHDPWFNPLFEFHGIGTYTFDHEYQANSGQGNFKSYDNDNTVECNLQVSPWPYWDVQTQIDIAGSGDTPYGFAAGHLYGRYQWFDDTVGDPLSLTTGVEFCFARSPFLRDTSFFYVGIMNTEFSASIGKAFYCGHTEWRSKLWAYAACGIANRGSPWIRGIGCWAQRLGPKFRSYLALFYRNGFGNNDLIANQPFPGYADIGYRFLTTTFRLEYNLKRCGAFSLFALYNLYAENGPAYDYGGGAHFNIPFSL